MIILLVEVAFWVISSGFLWYRVGKMNTETSLIRSMTEIMVEENKKINQLRKDWKEKEIDDATLLMEVEKSMARTAMVSRIHELVR